MDKIDFQIYEKHWNNLYTTYGVFLSSMDLLDFINKSYDKPKKQVMSEKTFQSLPKNGIALPVGIKPKGKWMFGLDAVTRWYLGMGD